MSLDLSTRTLLSDLAEHLRRLRSICCDNEWSKARIRDECIDCRSERILLDRIDMALHEHERAKARVDAQHRAPAPDPEQATIEEAMG